MESTRPRPVRRAAAPERIGILGGTFDPPHVGHLWLATLAADALGMAKVFLVPAASPPHKRRRAISHAADRILMTRLAVANDPRLDVSLVEMEREGPSYTVDTLVELKARHADADLVLIMAADSLAQIPSWREP
ncbi:MAG TPA: nicotinate-nucleotide adenylyltransferase, partial [Candidatus Limnocylindria bacterium]|nr:nicotinate-nucleotide adenylyltransferase [Candidatus Limnocylindria bacterium]